MPVQTSRYMLVKLFSFSEKILYLSDDSASIEITVMLNYVIETVESHPVALAATTTFRDFFNTLRTCFNKETGKIGECLCFVFNDVIAYLQKKVRSSGQCTKFQNVR